MSHSRITLLAAEGFTVFLAGVLITLTLGIIEVWSAAIVALIATLIVAFLYRDPQRTIPPSPLGIVSPVDGRIIAIDDDFYDPFAQRQAKRIRLLMNLSGVYTTRSPIEGKVNKQWYSSPNVISNTDDKNASDAKYFAQWVQTDEQDDVVLSLIPRVNLQPHCRVHSGERVGQGQRCGFILFGATVDVYIPVNSRIDVQVNDQVKAGSSLIATLVRERVSEPHQNLSQSANEAETIKTV